MSGIHVGRPRLLDLNYPENWVVILDTNAVLDREGSPVHVQVGVMSRIEGEEALHNLRQNRITISDKQGVHKFMWPGGGYAAGKCQLLDIDKDGVQEFLFSTFEGDDTYLRVVRFWGEKFQLRVRNEENLIGRSRLSLWKWYSRGERLPLSIGGRLKISIPIGNEKLLVQGIVKTCHQSFGNGIQFLKIAPADRVKLEAFLEGESFFENE